MKPNRLFKIPIIGAVIGTIAASLCCVGPLVLLSLGIGGAWISTLTQLEFLRPIGIAITLVFLVWVFWKLYIPPNQCAIDKPCANLKALKVQRIVFWVITFILVLILAFPWYAFLFY